MNFLPQFFWLAYSVLLSAVVVTSVICLRKDRSGPTFMMLLSGISWALLVPVVQTGYFFGNRLGWFTEPGSPMPGVLQMLGFAGSACMFIFHLGLLAFAMRLRRRSDRIAELEAIIQDLQQERDRADLVRPR